MDTKTKIKNLFGQKIQIAVPTYQRAYSWTVGKENIGQIDQFLEDIKNHNSEKDYYLGHFLFEKDNNFDYKYYVVDGQQRLTTIVIFMSSLIYELKKREIKDIAGESLEEISETYLAHYNQKFETVIADKYYFDERIIKQNFNAQPDSTRKSSNLLKDANDFFSKEFEKIQDITVLTTWYKVVANAIITTFVMEGPDAKLLATQIFAFQNDRGKDLTKLEKLKAYCMHKIYCCVTSEEITTQIQYMEKCFSEIYSKVEELSTFEDHILNWHCQAFTSWTKNEAFECIKYDFNNSDNKKQWLINFINSLSKTYKLMSKIEEAKKGNRDRIVADICYLDEANSAPLLLKLLHYGDRNFDEYNDILNVIEKILFKMRFTTGNYRTNNLINYAREYSGNNEELIKKLKDVVNSGFQWWWNFNDSCKKYFEENTYHYRSDIKYILYKYENYLRKEAKLPELDTNEYSNIFRSKKLENTLDHITPQNPNFTTYNEEFKSESLNNIGNLTLCTWSNNASKNNSNPAEIKEFYANIYLSHKEIYDTLKNTGKWGKEEISARKDKLLQFIKRQWDI